MLIDSNETSRAGFNFRPVLSIFFIDIVVNKNACFQLLVFINGNRTETAIPNKQNVLFTGAHFNGRPSECAYANGQVEQEANEKVSVELFLQILNKGSFAFVPHPALCQRNIGNALSIFLHDYLLNALLRGEHNVQGGSNGIGSHSNIVLLF